MNDPELIWRLGRWIARREDGAARLDWGDGELVLRVRRGKVVNVEGIDPEELSLTLGCAPAGGGDLLEEAVLIASRDGIAETQVVGSAKELLQKVLRRWLLDSERRLELVNGEPDGSTGPTISITHALVELVLSDVEQRTANSILPSRDVLLRRTGRFLELYAPLRLSEEADLIVAKITGQRTVKEICSRSPHGVDEVHRLLSALVVTGMLEPIPVVEPVRELDLSPMTDPSETFVRHRLPVSWIAAAAATLIVILGVLGYVISRGGTPPEEATGDGEWSLVVDMGCEPEELQRVLKKARQHPEQLRPVAANTETEDPCWRLVWGSFKSRDAAVQRMDKVPKGLLREGFEPHPIELPADGTRDLDAGESG